MALITGAPIVIQHQLSMMASSGTTLAMTLPTDRKAGHLMLAFAITYNATQAAPSGWTKILSPTTASSSRLHAMWRICDGTEAATINVVFSTSDVHIIDCMLIENAPTSAPIDTQVSGGAASVTKSLSTPAITPTTNNCLIVRGAGSAVVSSQTGPAGPGGTNYCNWGAGTTEIFEGWGNVLSTNRLGITVAATALPIAALNAAIIATSQPSTSPNSYGSGTVAIKPASRYIDVYDGNPFKQPVQRASLY